MTEPKQTFTSLRTPKILRGTFKNFDYGLIALNTPLDHTKSQFVRGGKKILVHPQCLYNTALRAALRRLPQRATRADADGVFRHRPYIGGTRPSLPTVTRSAVNTPPVAACVWTIT